MQKIISVIIEHSTIMPFRWSCNKFLCFYCCCTFIDSTKLKQHTREEHNEVKLCNVLKNISTKTMLKLDVSEISCKLCPKDILTIKDLLYHIINVHDIKFNIDVMDSLFVCKLSDEGMSCLDCGEIFWFFGPLLAHFHKFHVKTSEFLCETCGRSFMSKIYLDNHVKTVHSKCQLEPCQLTNALDTKVFKKLRCSKCPEVFNNSYQKRQHLANVHNFRTLNFTCDICSKVFIFKSKLVQHKARVHLKERNITCNVCGFKVFSQYNLKRHMVRHDDARPFQCDICKKTFQRKKTLDFHVRIHTNDKRCVCKECGKAFVQSTSLKLHLRVHHNKLNNMQTL